MQCPWSVHRLCLSYNLDVRVFTAWYHLHYTGLNVSMSRFPFMSHWCLVGLGSHYRCCFCLWILIRFPTFQASSELRQIAHAFSTTTTEPSTIPDPSVRLYAMYLCVFEWLAPDISWFIPARTGCSRFLCRALFYVIVKHQSTPKFGYRHEMAAVWVHFSDGLFLSLTPIIILHLFYISSPTPSSALTQSSSTLPSAISRSPSPSWPHYNPQTLTRSGRSWPNEHKIDSIGVFQIMNWYSILNGQSIAFPARFIQFSPFTQRCYRYVITTYIMAGSAVSFLDVTPRHYGVQQPATT